MLEALQEALQFQFVWNALIVGSIVAIITAIIGYFIIARGLTFTGHAIPNIGFAGAAGAVLLGVEPIFGLFAFTILAAIGIALLGDNIRNRDVSIGVVMTLALGLGSLFLSLYQGYAERVYSILIGTILGIDQTDVQVTAIVGVLTIIALLVLFRPLLFSSFDPVVAEARGVPVKALSIVFLVLIALTVSMSIQFTGALLVLTLLVGPAATATRLVKRPLWAILIAMLLGLLYVWLGVILAIQNGEWPVSFFIATISFVVYLPVRLLSPLWIGRNTRKLHQANKQYSMATREEISLEQQ